MCLWLTRNFFSSKILLLSCACVTVKLRAMLMRGSIGRQIVTVVIRWVTVHSWCYSPNVMTLINNWFLPTKVTESIWIIVGRISLSWACCYCVSTVWQVWKWFRVELQQPMCWWRHKDMRRSLESVCLLHGSVEFSPCLCCVSLPRMKQNKKLQNKLFFSNSTNSTITMCSSRASIEWPHL